jgi:hypothetical protein
MSVKSRWVGVTVCTPPVKAIPSGSLLDHYDEVRATHGCTAHHLSFITSSRTLEPVHLKLTDKGAHHLVVLVGHLLSD